MEEAINALPRGHYSRRVTKQAFRPQEYEGTTGRDQSRDLRKIYVF